MESNTASVKAERRQGPGRRKPLSVVLKKYWFVYVLVLPGLVTLLLFSYGPMYGILLAFKDFKPSKGIFGSPWTSMGGFKYFYSFLTDSYFWQVLKNTALINIYNLAFGFTFTIFLALMLNELRMRRTKRLVQTAVYLPYFLSWVIVAGLVRAFLDPQTGLINNIIVALGGKEIDFLNDNSVFRGVVVVSGMIKDAGYESILYLAAIAGVNPELYESAKVDGGNRYHMIRYINLPHIYPTIAVLLLMRVSRILVANFEQIYNLYNPIVFQSGDVIGTYLYRIGLEKSQYSLSTAVNLFSNLLGLVLLLICNKVVERANFEGIL